MPTLISLPFYLFYFDTNSQRKHCTKFDLRCMGPQLHNGEPCSDIFALSPSCDESVYRPLSVFHHLQKFTVIASYHPMLCVYSYVWRRRLGCGVAGKRISTNTWYVMTNCCVACYLLTYVRTMAWACVEFYRNSWTVRDRNCSRLSLHLAIADWSRLYVTIRCPSTTVAISDSWYLFHKSRGKNCHCWILINCRTHRW